MTRFRRMPDGNLTDSIDKYLDAWYDLRSPIEKVLGFETIGFDPGLLMKDPEGGTIDLPLGIAMKISKLCLEKG